MESRKDILRIFGKAFLRFFPVILLICLDIWFLDLNEWAVIVGTAVWFAFLWAAEALLSRRSRSMKRDEAQENPETEAYARFVINRARKVEGILFGILDVLLISILFLITQINPYWNSQIFRVDFPREESGSVVLSKKEVLEDYEFAMKYVKKIHPLAYGGLPEEMEQRAREVREWIMAQDDVEGYELARELESIVSLFCDGHTFVEEDFDEYHYMKHVYEHNKAGDRMVGVNGLMFQELLEQKTGLFSRETESYGIRLLKDRVVNIEGLQYLGIDVSGDIVYDYVTPDGMNITEVVNAEDFLAAEDYLAYEEEVTGDDLHGGEDRGFVFYDIDEEHSLAILTLRSCKYNDTYRDTLKDMFQEVADKNLQNVCVDLRDNSGGSSLVGNEFLSYLNVDSYRDWGGELRLNYFMTKQKGRTVKNIKRNNAFSGNVYVLTSVWTYSSAMDFAMLIQENGLGKVVGEASGNLPNGYGEVAQFLLPNSGLFMQVSTKKWYRIDESKGDLPILPDVECSPYEALDVLLEKLAEGN